MLVSETSSAERRIADAVNQAYSVVVTVNESNEIQAFRIAVDNEPLFLTIKADRRSRIQETAICSEAMLPGGPYDLWRERENSRLVKDLAGSFAQFATLPKMLHQKEILDTVAQGIREGIWVGQLMRPDRTVKTVWRTAVEAQVLSDPALEVFLPESATLSDIDPALLVPESLPGLWAADEIMVTDVITYFAGGHSVVVPKEGYEDTAFIPKCDSSAVEEAIADAVERGLVWLITGPASIFRETVPAGILNSSATLNPPPAPFAVTDLTEAAIPDAWREGKANVLAIVTAVSAQRGKPLPWVVVQSSISPGISTRWIELAPDSLPWPCDFANAQNVVVQAATTPGISDNRRERYGQKRLGTVTAEATLEANGV